MKLKYCFEDVNMGDEIISVPVGDDARVIHGVLKMNDTGKEIVDLLKEETTEEKIVEQMLSKHTYDSEKMSSVVKNIIETLKNAGLLTEE